MICTIVVCLVVLYLLVDRLIRVIKIRDHSNHHVFITGCDSGFGRALATRLDKLGFPVFAACYTEDGRKSLAEAGSSRIVVLPLDVTSSASIKEAFNTVKERLPDEKGLWAVVNNAGIFGQVVAAELCSIEEYQACINVNLLGPIEVSKTFMPLLRKSQGRLVNLTSIMGRCASEGAPYCASKYGLEGFTDVLRREVARFGVKVCLVEPGYMQTSLFHVDELNNGISEAFLRADPETQAAYGKDYPELVKAVLAGKLQRCSPDIYKVVDALEEAIRSVYPRARRVVGFDAKSFFLPLTYLPEWIGDRILLEYERRMAKKKSS